MTVATSNFPKLAGPLSAHADVVARPNLANAAQDNRLHHCRFCDAPLTHVLVDLGASPLCESYLSAEQQDQPERFYPLKVFICEKCLLTQLPAYVSGEHIFGEYAYFSSFSTSYLEHARRSAESAIRRFNITPENFVVELASNDGYLLKNFVERGISCLGVEPAANIARVAEERGIPTLNKFSGTRSAREIVDRGRRADLLLANNVLAHVPDINDFVRGMNLLLAPRGVAIVEIQYLLRLLQLNQFDTIYHEHFCYYTLRTLQQLFASHGLTIFDAEEISTHGGSIRVFARHAEDESQLNSPRVAEQLAVEQRAGLDNLSGYAEFASRVVQVKHRLLEFLISTKRAGKRVAGYGAPGKGNTLLNYCGIRQDFVDYTVDRNPYKQGKFLPGHAHSHSRA